MTDREFEEVFRKHAGMAYGLALGATGDPSAAEDAVQEAFMYLWRKGAGERADDLRAYLASAVINASRRHRRGEARRRTREEAAFAGPAASAESAPAGAVESAETHRAVRAALLGLSEERRLPVLLHVVQDFSQRDVARVLELSASTVSHRINQGLDELRAALARVGFAALAGPALAAALKAGWEMPVPAGLAAAAKAIAASTSSSGALKGGLIVKIGLGIATLGLVAGGALWAAGGKSGEPPKLAEPKAPRSVEGPPGTGHKDWEYTTLGGKIFVEWAALSGVREHLDGPGREGMACSVGAKDTQGCHGVVGDSLGNLYFHDHMIGTIRAWRRSDQQLLTLAGSGVSQDGGIRENEGPSYRLRLNSVSVHLAAVGDPLGGKGSVYFTNSLKVFRLFRNEAKGGAWWYECAVGGGAKKPELGQGCGALEIGTVDPLITVSPTGELCVFRGGPGGAKTLYWLRDGQLVPGYDLNAVTALIQAQKGRFFDCYGVDGKGQFIGVPENYSDQIAVVSPDGKSVKIVGLAYTIPWGVYPDIKRERWFTVGMDQFSGVGLATPEGSFMVKYDGDLGKLAKDQNIHKTSAPLCWRNYRPLADGRFVGWDSGMPIFVGTWLEGK